MQATAEMKATAEMQATTRIKAEGRTRNSRDVRNSRDANNRTSISRNANSTVFTPTTYEFSQKFAKYYSSQNGEKFAKKYTKRVRIAHYGSDTFQSVR